MAKTCIMFLLLKGLYQSSSISSSESDEYNDDDIDELSKIFEFLDYAAIYWPAHFSRVRMDDRKLITPLVHKLCGTENTEYSFWYPVYWEHEQRGKIGYLDAWNFEYRTPDTTGLIFVTTLGYTELVDYFLSHGADINEIAREFGTALHVAACMGKPGMVEFLISRGASVNARGGDHGTALLAALRGRQEGVALSLIKSGAYMEGENIWEEDAVVLASSFGYLSVVKAVLHQGNIQNMGKALKGAIEKGHNSVSSTLIEYETDIETEAGLFTVAMREKQRNIIREWNRRRGGV
ncbi:hypothetical protein N7509_000718 [Penicillium cosmopolitanum]|uniref:Uncharacterized protein n=1 Tax=Penicillium cosmopolitanum TaxID=1131564 RepID=A0A9X0BEC0_9EURO|nr:uncharacterized protein N7509_000718 [Penicillium cosmopolitanum]KAJ5414091.1 hypothetical protein N7509_000718 [Penicillium cosmopolitanum]